MTHKLWDKYIWVMALLLDNPVILFNFTKLYLHKKTMFFLQGTKNYIYANLNLWVMALLWDKPPIKYIYFITRKYFLISQN